MLQNILLYRMTMVSAVLLLFACAPATVRQEPTILYPALPDEPRIAYLMSYYGEPDFQEISFFDKLFGAPRVRSMIKPYGVASNGDTIYVTLAGKVPDVAVIKPKERKVEMLSEKPRVKFGLPTGIAAAKNGTIYVADSDLKKIHVFDEKGAYKTAFGSPDDFQRPAGLAINESLSRLYVADSFGHGVTVFSLSGQRLFRFGAVGTKDGELYYPTNIAVDRRNGDIAVADTQNFRVQVFDKDGKFLRKFGEVGDLPGNFTRPKGIGVDSEGHIYVADAGFDNFQVFDETGRLLIFIGSFGTAGGYFQSPAGLYIDENDRIYVVDALNNRVCVYQYFSTKWIKANPEEYKKYLNPSPPK